MFRNTEVLQVIEFITSHFKAEFLKEDKGADYENKTYTNDNYIFVVSKYTQSFLGFKFNLKHSFSIARKEEPEFHHIIFHLDSDTSGRSLEYLLNSFTHFEEKYSNIKSVDEKAIKL